MLVAIKHARDDLRWNPPLNVLIDIYGAIKRMISQKRFRTAPIIMDKSKGIKLKRKQKAANSYNS